MVNVPGTVTNPDGELNRLARLGASGDRSALHEVANQLEGIFFSMMVKQMRESMSEGGLFGDGVGADTYEGFFDEMMGESLSGRGDLGIAEMVLRQAMDLESGRVVTPADFMSTQAAQVESDES